jgi:hypothetical protein
MLGTEIILDFASHSFRDPCHGTTFVLKLRRRVNVVVADNPLGQSCSNLKKRGLPILPPRMIITTLRNVSTQIVRACLL